MESLPDKDLSDASKNNLIGRPDGSYNELWTDPHSIHTDPHSIHTSSEMDNRITPSNMEDVNTNNLNIGNKDTNAAFLPATDNVINSVITLNDVGFTDSVRLPTTDELKGQGVNAPDGGWGWVVMVAVFFSSCTFGFDAAGFSVLYVALVEHFQSDRGVTGWVGSLHVFTGNFMGVIIGAFIERYGSRVVSMTGTIIGATGIALSAFLINIPYLYFTFGIVGGIGYGMCVISSSVILQNYFSKKRPLAMGIGSSGMAVGALVSYVILDALLSHYGLSGTMLIMAGIWLQNIVFASFFRPVKRHVKNKRTKDCEETPNGNEKQKPKKESSMRVIIKDICNFSVLRNVKLQLYLIGTLLYFTGMLTTYVHFLSRALHLGIDRRLAIIFQTVMSTTTWLSRIVISIVANRKQVDRVLLLAVLVTLSGLAVITLPVAKVPIVLCIYAIVHGLFAGGYLCLQFTVLADIAGINTIAKTTGFFSMALAVTRLLSIPLAGFLFDISQDYDLPFYVMGAVHLVGAGVLLVLAVLNRTRWKPTTC